MPAKHILPLCLTLGSLLSGYGQTRTVITGHIKNEKDDTIKIYLQETALTRITHLVPVLNGSFKAELNITSPASLYMTDGVNYINGFSEPGDSCIISYDAANFPTSLAFGGKGKERFSFINSFIRSQLYNKLKEQVPLAKGNKYPFDHLFNFLDSTGHYFLKKLDSIKPFMSKEAFALLNMDVNGTIMINKYRSVGMIYHESTYETLEKRKDELTDNAKKEIQQLLKFEDHPAYSPIYINAVYTMLLMDFDTRVLTGRSANDLPQKYKYISTYLPPHLKTPVLTMFLEFDISKLNQSEDIEALISQTYTNAKDSIYKKYILQYYANSTAFKKGMNAPDFILEDESGKKVTLSSFKGKTIYLDFWYEACGPCHALFKTLQPVKEHFSQNEQVVFLCISIDKKDTWKTSLQKRPIKGQHVYTENKAEEHPVIKAYKVSGYPTSCLIDGKGRIFSAAPSNSPAELTKQIEEAIKITGR
ncbi:redoxin domain-containing protein [Chitinophaga sp. SYP-B3965]|uniref:TlpA family protein disulfide reductase n=1 Tax=Chitinophaga sp. SYP-B3965 TaxID=2663120 RepID=UPI0012999C9E|nr:TlpA disulfide reductase family protein [Chitinophaga sp. SYP-B3965]MRG43921.1 redoxin domain-containing protein [Chitinophaga sp. SYP-B3965]